MVWMEASGASEVSIIIISGDEGKPLAPVPTVRCRWSSLLLPSIVVAHFEAIWKKAQYTDKHILSSSQPSPSTKAQAQAATEPTICLELVKQSMHFWFWLQTSSTFSLLDFQSSNLSNCNSGFGWTCNYADNFLNVTWRLMVLNHKLFFWKGCWWDLEILNPESIGIT